MPKIIAIALFFGLFSAQAAEPLFQEIAAPRAASELEPTVLRERHVVLTTTTFAESVRLNLFDGTELEFERSKVRRQALGGEVWQGEDGKGGRAYLSTVGQAVAGTIWADGKLFELRHRGDGRHLLTEVDDTKFEPEGCDDHEHEHEFEHALRRSMEQRTSRAPDGAGVIDLLVLYTPKVREIHGGAEGVEALIHLAIGVTNAANEDSDVTTRFSPVHIAETDYLEAALEFPGDDDWDVFDDRNRLRDMNDGFMDEAHTLRDTYCADIVHLITAAGGGWCGAAYIQQTPMDASHEVNAFAVTKHTCAVGGMTFAHEMGHTLGAQHDWYVDDSQDPWVYSHGFNNPDEGWRTIMSYSTRCSDMGETCSRIPFWSNPNKFFGGKPLGVAEGTDDSCVEDNLGNPDCDAENWRVINNNDATVANFRERQACISTDDVWMKDTWNDTGAEPDALTVGEPMWKSPYIWVRNDFDATGEKQHQHEDPEFGQQNWIYVKLHNDFNTTASGELKLYYADASTLPEWPSDWTLIDSFGVNNIASHGTLLQPVAWTPSEEIDYALLARWASPTNPVDPMAVAEGVNTNVNVRNNNNIVWRNTQIVDLEPNIPFFAPEFGLDNPSPAIPTITMEITLPDDEEFLGRGGRVWVDLGNAYDAWVASGGTADGVRPTTIPGAGEVLEILSAATIDQIPLSGSEPARLIFEAPVLPIPPIVEQDAEDEPETPPTGDVELPEAFGPQSFGIDVAISQGTEALGGISYIMQVMPQANGSGSIAESLRLDKDAAGALNLSWDRSCQSTDEDFAVYVGTLGEFTSHLPEECSTGGATSVAYPMPGESLYYLVVPTDGVADGGYGVDSDGAERSQGPAACRLRVGPTC